MSAVERMIRWYGWLVRLYPRQFQADFGAELQTVFAQSVREAAAYQAGSAARGIWACFLRELLDLPLNLLREYVSSTGLNLLVERWLAHPKRSRWQQAGSLAFALGFALLEFLHGLPQVFATRDRAFDSWWGFVNATPTNNSVSPDSLDLPLQLLDFAGLLLCGLIVGLIFSMAERNLSRTLRLRFTIVGAAALFLPYGIAALLERFPVVLLLNFGQTAPEVWAFVRGILVFLLIGGLPAAILGRTLGVRSIRHLGSLFSTGVGGLLFSLAAAILVVLVLGLIWIAPFLIFSQSLSLSHIPWETLVLGNLLLAVVFGAVQGWVYGGITGWRINDIFEKSLPAEDQPLFV